MIPDDLTSLSDADLAALSDKTRSDAEALAAEAATSDDALTQLEALVADVERVQQEITSRQQVANERADRAAAALDKLSAPDATETSPEAEAETPAPAEMSIEGDEDGTPEDGDNPEDEVNEFATLEVTMNEGSTDDTGAEALTRLVPDAIAPRTEEMSSGAALFASNAVPGLSEGTALDNKALAAAIARKRHGMSNSFGSTGSFERIVLATASSNLPNKVSGGAEENFGVFAGVSAEWAATRGQQTALVASGGNCAPLPPSYEFFRLAEPLNPVEAALPTVEAPRGGIRFITPPDWRDAYAGVRVTTEAEDAAGYGEGYTAPKPCVHVTCPPIEECRVDAVSQCVTFGNLNYRVFPEQVEAFLKDLAVAFSSTKETFYLDAIDGASTAVTATPAYGATRGVTQTILSAAANYRRRQHMGANAVLTLMLPSWVVEFVKVDMVNDHALGLNFLNAGETEVTAWLASANLDVSWYYDSATGAGQSFADNQSAGAINAFPTSIVGYLFAPGTFVRLDAGTLDVGIVRDSILNGTNDLQIFSEQWVQVCQVGLESLRLEITLCPDGTGPEPVTPLVCD